ncbi:MAG: haloalkane dehalogenase [Haloarculaceae archaeon]
MALVSTPEERFEDLPGYDYDPEYVSVGDPEMAYLDEGEGEETFLCLHGEPTWSYLYRKMLPKLAERGRVVVPDYVGFGRSEKYTEMDDYSFSRYREWTRAFVEELDLTDVTLVCQDWGGILGLRAVADMPERFARVVPMNTGMPDGTQEMSDAWWEFRNFVAETEDIPIGMLIQNACATDLPEDVVAAYEAPFHDAASKAGARAWPLLVPTNTEDDGAAAMAEVREFFSEEWEKPAFVLFSDSDPITGDARTPMRELIATAEEQPDVWVEGGGHFLQEDRGEAVAEHVLSFVDRT